MNEFFIRPERNAEPCIDGTRPKAKKIFVETNFVCGFLIYLLIFCSLASGASAGLLEDYMEVAKKDQQGYLVRAHLESLTAPQLMELSENLATMHEREYREHYLEQKGPHFGETEEGFFYEFSRFQSVYRMKSKAKVEGLLSILNNPAKSLLLKKTVVEYFTSNSSTLTPEEKTRLIDGMKVYKEQVSGDSMMREQISRQQSERVREELQAINLAKASPEQAAAKRASLAPRVNAHMREIIDDLSSRTVIDREDATRLCAAYMDYARLGFQPDKGAVDLTKRLFNDPAKCPLDVRINLAASLALYMGEPSYLTELEKIKNDPANQAALKAPRKGSSPLEENLDNILLSPIKTYEDAVAFVKERSPEDPLFEKAYNKLRGIRIEMKQKGQWSKANDMEVLKLTQDALARATSPQRKEEIQSRIRSINIEITGIQPTPIRFGQKP